MRRDAIRGRLQGLAGSTAASLRRSQPDPPLGRESAHGI